MTSVNNKPVARFAGKFESLDTVIPLANGQILTFFAPILSVEYVNGEQEDIELPKMTFEDAAKEIEARVQANPDFLKDRAPLILRPMKVKELMAEATAAAQEAAKDGDTP